MTAPRSVYHFQQLREGVLVTNTGVVAKRFDYSDKASDELVSICLNKLEQKTAFVEEGEEAPS